MRRLIYIFAIIAALAVLGGCARRGADPRLTEIAAMVADSPAVAIDRLDAIGRDSLSDADRALCGLLTVKARDKAYITHSSDSLILSVIDYYERHRASGLYPEALYYGGRVYADMGDAPSALRHFQTALDELPDAPSSPDCIRLKGCILYQTGYTLNSLHLYDKAATYLTESLITDSLLNDSINSMRDYQLLGAILLHQDRYEEAENHFKKARRIAKNIKSQDNINQQEVYLAAIKMDKHEFDSARALIRPVMKHQNFVNRDHALAYAASIYLNLNLLDTAYVYARALCNNDSSNAQLTGLQIIMSPQLKNYIPRDSLYFYVSQLRKLTSRRLGQNTPREVLLQTTLYNYQIHEREHIKADKENSKLWISLIASILVILFAIIVILLLNNNKNKKQKELLDTLLRLKQLQETLNVEKKQSETNESNLIASRHKAEDETAPHDSLATNLKITLKEQLRQKFLELSKKQLEIPQLNPAIEQSEVYGKLQGFIKEQRTIPDYSSLWNELDAIVTATSPNFHSNLQLLIGSTLKENDYRMAILIKCGVSPTQLVSLLGRTKGTISNRRRNLCIKLLGEDQGAAVFDKIIRKL